MRYQKIIFLFAAALTALSANAQSVTFGDEESNYILHRQPTQIQERYTTTPFDEKDIVRYRPSGIGDNWFVSAEVGPSFFYGIPTGCGDLFDRAQPSLSFSLGKWHSPFFGTRLKYQGFKAVDAASEKVKYTLVHQDFLLNVSSFFHRSYFEDGARWNVSPFVGAGLFRNDDRDKNKLAVTYGVKFSYKVCPHLHVKGELSGLMSTRTWDGFGKSGKIGDGLYTASVGVVFGLGKEGWKRKHGSVVEKYIFAGTSSNNGYEHQRNNYSGLNSLKSRLGIADSVAKFFQSPVLFFFKINSTALVDRQQMHNIDEIAHIAKTYGMNLRIIGAADSKTGSKSYNRKLSIARAKYIAKCFIRRGVPKSQLSGSSLGGVDMYHPYPANRHTCVIVYQGELDRSKYEYGE